jgi:hypothetical protein
MARDPVGMTSAELQAWADQQTADNYGERQRDRYLDQEEDKDLAETRAVEAWPANERQGPHGGTLRRTGYTRG